VESVYLVDAQSEAEAKAKVDALDNDYDEVSEEEVEWHITGAREVPEDEDEDE
jgi:hypothetical protein